MDDFERYGDYDNTEEDEQPKKSIGGLIIKIVAAVLILAVVSVLGARIFIFNYYPDEMKNLYFTDSLTAYYNQHNGDIGALTQQLLYPYDDNDEGNFFCSNLIVVRDAGHLQITLRYNVSLSESMAKNYGLQDFDTENHEQFSFRLWRDGLTEGDEGCEVGRLVAVEWDSFAMYRYARLTFEGIDFAEDTEEKIEWIRLEVTVDGAKKVEPFMILIYENHAERKLFEEYTLGKKERP